MRRESDSNLWLYTHSSFKETEGKWRNMPHTAHEQKVRIETLLKEGMTGNKNDYFVNDPKVCMKLAFTIPYQNFISYTVDGIRDYCTKQHIVRNNDGHYNVFHALTAQTNVVRNWHLKQQEYKKSSSGWSIGNSNAMSKGAAMKRIEDLNLRLTIQRRDFELGRRGYDESVEEIRATEAEIQSLKRKYINKFYFF